MDKTESINRIIKQLFQQTPRHYEYNLIDKIRRDSITLRRYYEYECNGCTRDKLPLETWQAYDRERAKQMEWIEKRIKIVKSRIERNVRELGLYCYHQTDPRGASVYISNFEIKNDSYATSGIAVY